MQMDVTIKPEPYRHDKYDFITIYKDYKCKNITSYYLYMRTVESLNMMFRNIIQTMNTKLL